MSKKTVVENVNEATEVVAEAVNDVVNENLTKLNAKDVVVTIGAGGLVILATLVSYEAIRKVFEKKNIKFRNPFAKKPTVAEVVEETVEAVAEEIKS